MQKKSIAGKLAWVASLLIILTTYTAGAVDITLNSSTKYQTIDGFGASVMNWLGTIYADAQNRSDYVQDLGCSIIRGELHPSAITKADCMDANPTTFSANIDANAALMDFTGQSRVAITGSFMQAVYNQRIDEMKVMLSIWTPPHWLKTNAVLSTEYGCQSYQGHLTRTDANRTQFARYAAAWVKGFSNAYGLPVYGLSVQNELDWAHDPSTWTTSCQYFSTSYPTDRSNGPPLGENDFNPVIAYLYNELNAANLGAVKLMGPEKSHILSGSTYEMDVQMSFINDMAANGTAMQQMGILCYHGYETTPGNRTLNTSYWNKIKSYGKPSWQTEAGGQSLNWQGAMDLATVIQDELVAGNVSAYLYWSYAGEGNDLLSLKINGTAKTDKYTAFKHFSRYLRPGAARIGCTPSDSGGLAVSAYKHDAQGTITVVIVNTGSAQAANITLPAGSISSCDVYTSSAGSWWNRTTAIVNNNIVSVSVPAAGLVTIYGRAGTTPAPTPTPSRTPIGTPTVTRSATPTTSQGNLVQAPRNAAVASSQASTTWSAAGVIDNITTPDTGWSSAIAADGTAQWIYLDMGAAYNLQRVVLVPRTQTTATNVLAFPAAFSFESSPDAAVWTTIPGQLYTGYPKPANNNGESFLFGTAVSCRYLRVTATVFGLDDFSNKHLQLAEIYLYMTGTAAAALGDVNGDGKIDIIDALMTAQYGIGLNPAGFDAAKADVNKSGSIDIVDALMIAQKYVGIITEFPG